MPGNATSEKRETCPIKFFPSFCDMVSDITIGAHMICVSISIILPIRQNGDQWKLERIFGSFNEIYSPVVKLSRSGELEVLPIAPHGLTEIPFGSSIIIGQNDPRDNIPSAPISSIEITPETLQLLVTFEDSGSSNMLIKSTWKDTKVIFKDIKTTKDPLQFPLVTVAGIQNITGFRTRRSSI
jgi:hypothetical protein